MTSYFDFTSYASPPVGWRLLEASKECLRLYHTREARQYIITSREAGTFKVHYSSEVQREPQFVFASTDFRRVLELMGCLHKARVT